MKAMLSIAAATAIALGSVMPLQAAPLQAPAVAAPEAAIIKVQNRSQMEFGQQFNNNRRWNRGRDWRGDRRWRGDRDWRDDRRWRYRDRDWDDDDDDLAIGLGAFAAGALLGGALNSGPRTVYRGNGNAHVEWCYDRYRSYRASDNTFQPYNGPRKQCYSPYS